MAELTKEETAQLLGSLLAGDEVAPDSARLQEGARRLVGRWDQEDALRHRELLVAHRRRYGWAAGVLVPVLAAAAWVLFLRGSQPSAEAELSWVVAGQSVTNDRELAATQRDVSVEFSEGSTFRLLAGGALRIGAHDARGANVILQRGTLEARVTHRPETRWKVSAGPYDVHVTGTRFQSRWDESSQTLEVVMEDGSVEVTGAGITGGVALRAGQRLVASAATERWNLSDARGGANGTEPRSPEEELSPDEPAPDETAAEVAGADAPAVRPVPRGDGWSQLVRRGAFRQVLAEARTRGLETCFERCGVADLRALADAARYSGEPALAQRALGDLRRRSPHDAPRAAYLLGTLAESRGDRGVALRWYEQSLAEAPTGAVASEARTGRLRMVLVLKGRGAARPLAEDYLRLYPDGVGAETARRILEGR